jgi:translocation and assembly module TamA
LFSLPLHLTIDKTDAVLDPSHGGRMAFLIEPFINVLGEHQVFLKGMITGAHYLKLFDDPSVVFAMRLNLGSIGVLTNDTIPLVVRYYAGGGGSVRGYDYQLAGPLSQNRPVGGKSLAELSVEVRARFSETVGAVCFFDAGSAFRRSLPQSSERLYAGAGAGFRYYTPVGPLRLDIAVPVKPWEKSNTVFKTIFNIVKVYISVGQSF